MKRPQIDIIFEDEHLLAVNKPPNLPSIPDRYKPEAPNLLHLLQTDRPGLLTVHRLDRQTSGVIVFAKTAEAHRHLSLQFQNREVEKIYWAIVAGQPATEFGTIDAPIGPGQRGKMVVTKTGKQAVTAYRLLERFRGFSLVEARPLTGRTHQIRVHLQHIGIPLATDPLYGASETLMISDIKRRGYSPGKKEVRPLLARSALHAREVQLLHPFHEQVFRAEADPPRDFQAALTQLRKWAALPG